MYRDQIASDLFKMYFYLFTCKKNCKGDFVSLAKSNKGAMRINHKEEHAAILSPTLPNKTEAASINIV